MEEILPARKTAGNESTGLLKLLALVFMFADHAGKMLLPRVPEMRMLGRLAFPLYAWCLVVGICYTRSPLKYLLRILLIGVLSQYPYMVVLSHLSPVGYFLGIPWYQTNIFLTLALGLCALWGVKENRWFSACWAPPLALALAALLKADYGWRGVLLMLLFYGCRGSRAAIGCMFAAFCLYWGSASSAVPTLFGVSLRLKGVLQELLSPWLRLQALAILSLPLILWRPRKRLRLPSWAGYALYPAHLLVLWLLEKAAGVL